MDLAPVRGIIFDKDGTLFDFARSWEAWAHAFLLQLAADPAEAEALGARIGFDMRNRRFAPDSIAIAGTTDEIAQRLRPLLPAETGANLVAIMNAKAEEADLAEVTPLVPFFRALRRGGLPLGLVTNDAEAPARAHLERSGITAYFDFIAGHDSGHGAKPAPGQLLAGARAFRLRPESIVMVGDSLHDMRAARAAGMRAVAVLTGMADAGELQDHAEIVLRDISQLPDWLSTQTVRRP